MKITETYKPTNRKVWRDWLNRYHQEKKEIWVLYDDRSSEPTFGYLESVEEAICFGWIDGLQKRFNEHEKAQRFTPRKKKSNWTELNKERARKLIQENRMTESGFKLLPDLSEEFVVPQYIMQEIKNNPVAYSNYKTLPELYIRVRIGYINEMRNKPEELEKRLTNFINKTEQGKLFGNWNDGGRLGK